jgi:hypothetical protein
MRPLCLMILMWALGAIIAAPSSNVTWTSYAKALSRHLNDNNNKYIQNDLALRDTIKEQDSDEDSNERLDDVLQQRIRRCKFHLITQCFFLTKNRINNYNRS